MRLILLLCAVLIMATTPVWAAGGCGDHAGTLRQVTAARRAATPSAGAAQVAAAAR